MIDGSEWIKGRCPACSKTGVLFVGEAGHVTCSWATCPAPGAVDDLLNAADAHYVVFTRTQWVVEHSLFCRVSEKMHECAFHDAVARVVEDGPPDEDGMGRWRIDHIDAEGLPALVRA